MSIYGMTRLPNAAGSAAGEDIRPEGIPTTGTDGAPVPRVEQAGDPTTSSGLQKAVESVVTFIPTEVVTVYVAAGAAITVPGQGPAGGQWLLLAVMLVLTPVVTWALYCQAAITRGDSVPVQPAQWPRQRMVVSMLAFLLWGFGLPGTPFQTLGWFRPGLAAVVLLVGTMLIGLVAPLLPEMRGGRQ